MSGRYARFVGVFAIVTALASLSFVAAAGARSHRRCSLRAGPLTPTLSRPCNRAAVQVGHDVTFTVFDENSKAHLYRPFIELTKKKPDRRWRLPRIPGADGFFAQLNAVKGHSARFTFRAPSLSYPGWWLVTPGRYYVQIDQVDNRAGQALTFYSPVSTIYVR